MKIMMISASTVCGRISPAGMGSVVDRRFLEEARAETAAGLIGAGTLRAEDPEMRGPDGQIDPHRIRALVTGSGNIPFDKKIFSQGPAPIVFSSQEKVAPLTGQLGERARVIGLPAGPGGLSLAAAVRELAGLGVDSLLVEGGAGLNYVCLAEGLVDELLLTITPNLSGDRQAVTLAQGPGPLGSPFLPLELVSCETSVYGEIMARYKVIKTAGGIDG